MALSFRAPTASKLARRPRPAMSTLLDSPRFELVPLPSALDLAANLPAGANVTVTSSPSRGVEATIGLTEQLARQGFHAVPHLAAREFTDERQLSDVVRRLRAAGVTDVFVVGGDATSAAGPYENGLALLQALTNIPSGFGQIGVPSYPEGHHAISEETLWQDLAAKQQFATYTVTQLCFDADKICRFAAEAARRGITLPVTVGIAGPVGAARLVRISLKVGVGESLRFVRGHHGVARRLLHPRGYRPDALVRRLTAQVRAGRCELAGLHIYTFNQVQSTLNWLGRRGGRSS